MAEIFRMPVRPSDKDWVWPKDYTSVDLHLVDSIEDELRVIFGRYMHVDSSGSLSSHFSKSASIDVSRLRNYLGAMGEWNLWFGADMLGGSLVVAGTETAIIVPSRGRGESWELRSRAIIAGCPAGETFAIWRTHEDYFPKVAISTPYDGPPLPDEATIDETIAAKLTAS